MNIDELTKMSTGGIFQLIANTGRQDRMLMATDLLRKRLDKVYKLRCKRPDIRDPTPTLVDIERTHIFYMNAHFKPFVAIGYEYNHTSVQEGEAKFGGEVSFSIPQFGDFFHDMVVHVQINPFTLAGFDIGQYFDFPGHKLFKRTKFEVNGNFLDEYDSDTYNFHYQFRVPEYNRVNWKRCVGQQVLRLGKVDQSASDVHQEHRLISVGPQTPSDAFRVLDMWIPLLFWFNKDPRLSIPSVSIPYGQRFIRIELATFPEIFTLNPLSFTIPPTIAIMDLYINNIFVNPEIHDIFIQRVGFTLIRVHRTERANVDQQRAEILFDQLKFPVETFYMGVHMDVLINDPEDWWKFYLPDDATYVTADAIPNPGIPPPVNIIIAADVTFEVDQIPILDTLRLTTHGIELYRETPAKFFNCYVPYNYGGASVGSPEDIGAYMITFNLYPGAYQPSGHINLSNTREFFVGYSSQVLTPIDTGVLVVVAVALNFLLIADGSAVLRYNT
jgi:hypothetical protein